MEPSPVSHPSLSFVAALAAASLVCLVATASELAAQPVDTLRGRVTLPDSASAVGAIITVTPVGATAAVTVTADSAGAYQAVVVRASAYDVLAALPGYAPVRVRLPRPATGSGLVADLRFNTARAAAPLAPVKVVERRRQRPIREGVPSDRGGDAPPVGATGFVAPGDAGDLNALAGRTLGVEQTDGGFSVFGLPADQNSVALNGVPVLLDAIPPGSMRVGFAASPIDVAQGGFSGGQISLSPAANARIFRNFIEARLHAPALQFADRTGARLGQEYTNVDVNGQSTGPLVYGRSTYGINYRLGRHLTDLSTLLSADAGALARAGVAPDSVTRLLGLLEGLGVPGTTGGVPRHTTSDQASLSLHLASWPSAWGARTSLTAIGTWQQGGGLGLGPTVLPAAGRGSDGRSGALQLQRSSYRGSVLQSWSATVSGSSSQSAGYLALPEGRVQVASDSGHLALLRFGGAPGSATASSGLLADLRQGTSWRSRNNAHSFDVTTSLGYQRTTSRVDDQLGSYVFGSLAELAAGQPASYARTIGALARRGDALMGGLSIRDSWRATPQLFVQAGARADARWLGTPPVYNPAVDSAFGQRTDHAPRALSLSPRVGFTWIPPSQAGKRRLVESLHGGVGLYVDGLSTALLGDPRTAAGLPTSVQRLLCVGAAVPVPDWDAYRLDPARTPTTCADGGAPAIFTDTAPRVELFAADYRAPRRWHGNLEGSTTLLPGEHKIRLHAGATMAWNRAQPGFIDRNLVDDARFVLADEGGRPVFVAPSAVVPATGAVAPGAARPSTRFANVLERRSDLHSEVQQYSVSLTGEGNNQIQMARAGKESDVYWYTWALTYLHTQARDEVRGTSAPTLGHPNAATWGRSSLPRHAVGAAVSATNAVGSIALHVRRSSGNAYTPLVSGDVNGDGWGADPAFVFDPALAADPEVAEGMRTLLGQASPSVRACLGAQLGRVAARNSCAGAWSTSLDAAATLKLRRFGLPREATAKLTFQNLLPGLDRLVHGSDVRGWGRAAMPDPTLLSVRGFDPATNRFRYAVNQRFGDAGAARALNGAPFQMVLSFRMPLGPNVERQEFREAITDFADGRRGRRSAAAIQQAFMRGGSGIAFALASARDTIQLTAEQLERISAVEREHQAALQALWGPAARELAALPEPLDERAAFERMRATQREQRELLVRYVRSMRGVLSAHQLELLPESLKSMLDPRRIPAVD